MILIVGGAGYIGSHANKLLSGKGFATVVLDNLSTGHRRSVKWGKLVVADLADREALDRLFREHVIEVVMHFGACIEVGESVLDPEKYYRNNVAHTLNLLSAMRAHGVDKLVFSSTCAVYGFPEAIPLVETHPLRPINPYGRTKRMVEDILDDYSRAYGLRYVSLRYFNAAGADPEGEIGEAHIPETHLIPLAILAAMGKSGRLNIYGDDYKTRDGTCVRDYIHVSDLATAHLAALEYLNAGGESAVFNLGNGEGYTVREIVESVERVSGRSVPICISPRRPGDPALLVGSAKQAMMTLNWKPVGGIEEIVRSAWNWHQSGT